jgi:hypothetical protein
MVWISGDSFDVYRNPGDAFNAGTDLVPGAWESATQFSGTPVRVSSANTRFSSGQCLLWPGTTSGFLLKNWGTNDAVVLIACAYYASIVGSEAIGTGMFFTFRDGTADQCTVQFSGDGNIYVRGGGVTAAIIHTFSSPDFLANSWMHLQIKVTINNATGRVQIRLNGAGSDTWDSGAGLNTRNGTANNYTNSLTVYSNVSFAQNAIDDFLLISCSGAAPNDWVGDVRALMLMPNADTAQKDFSRSAGSDNYALVDEDLQDDDTTYVYSSTVGHIDRYTLENLSVTPVSILNVQARQRVKKYDSGARSSSMVIKSGATTVTSGAMTLSSSYGWQSYAMVTDPDTAAAWTQAGVDALELGPKVDA